MWVLSQKRLYTHICGILLLQDDFNLTTCIFSSYFDHYGSFVTLWLSGGGGRTITKLQNRDFSKKNHELCHTLECHSNAQKLQI